MGLDNHVDRAHADKRCLSRHTFFLFSHLWEQPQYTVFDFLK